MKPVASMVLGGVSIGVERWNMIVVYDRATGRIVHRHQHVTFKGAQPPDNTALERKAMEFASREGGRATRGLASLHVDPESLKEEAEYKVDTNKRVLAEIKRRATATRRR